jgi:hypothetical protein
MVSGKRAFLRPFLFGAAALVFLLPAAPAQEFRVDTELFKDQEKEPFLEQLTIFAADGVVYDFRLTEPRETTVFDPRNGRFTLLDEARKAKAVVTTQELLQFCLALDSQAVQQRRDPLFAFSAKPEFEISDKNVEENGQALVELRLAGKPLTYVARGQHPQRPEAVKAYRNFTDWCARLNASRFGNLPAGARLVLNQALAEHDLLPLEITRTTVQSSGPLSKKQLEVKSQHRLNWALAGEDRKKINRAGDMIATFQAVSYDEYRSVLDKPIETKQARR